MSIVKKATDTASENKHQIYKSLGTPKRMEVIKNSKELLLNIVK